MGVGCLIAAGCDIPVVVMPAADEALSRARQARHEGNLSFAREQYLEAAKIYAERNDALAYAHTIRHVADIYLQERNFLEAAPLYEEALSLYRGNLNTKLLDLANTVRPYALLVEQRGDDPILANSLWEEAKGLYRSLRLNTAVAECDAHLAHR